ncbi:MAG: M15 family metallopeptidase [Clostridia bacterium]|nr:M15 family metallopeptidase [Clostridia bacterium]
MSKRKNSAAAQVTRFFIVLLSVCLIGIIAIFGFKLLPVGGDDTSAPDTSSVLGEPTKAPDTTVPDITVVTSPDTTVDTTAPDTTVPDTTVPDTTVPDTTVPTPPEPTYDLSAWYLTLVNPWNKLSVEYIDTIELTKVNGKQVDVRMVEPLKQMLNDCYEANKTTKNGCEGKPLVCSGFRSQATQENLFTKKINNIKKAKPGISDDEAYALAAKEVAIPGTSEHQLGLAVDIVCCVEHYNLDAQKTKVRQQWLIDNCHKYGFILRYPADKTDVTGIIYEPWHYRYVGVEVATEIMSRGICFEEWLAEQKAQ